ncbi:winged helix-turn-helix domain-containing protein [Vibrio bivalvicida]|nr:helix-turn-helix domain-containing protein [Vibrio bivalvicida]
MRVDTGQALRISHSEVLILQKLTASPGKTIPREILISECWPGRIVTSSSLNVAIKNLRQAFEQLGHDNVIVTDPGKGYLLRREPPYVSNQDNSLDSTEAAPPANHISFQAQPSLWRWFSFGLGILVTLYTFYLYLELVEQTEIEGVTTYYDGFELEIEKLPSNFSQLELLIAYPKGGSVNCLQIVGYADSTFTTYDLNRGGCTDE